MPLELKIKDRKAKIEVLHQEDSTYHVKIDGKEYHLDVLQVESSVYSVLYQNQSINLEMIEGDNPNQYKVNTRADQFTVDVIDPVTRYKSSRSNAHKSIEQIIVSPMPGRIVSVLVKEGDPIEEGQTALIVSAMKMESEYKAPISGVVSKIHISAGDTIRGGVPLIEIEPQSR
ncbi:biotin/lipoyl-containing protein [Saccharicrinis fermentans]|uniref:2-oxoglutarate carboxylase large subunit n=1 Tax=Saccharicrinis fermentans DSM 9555 = JCM 21142 TaxID=869213 RepID=W7YQY6_9BACT|nr:biotin/lipoyl-containing protein [Saccharicrinis fermentans]GAF04839.1 2-oxoglutarate carboxylase large subunit [Saccharicrinis fermentans DSM 9555 = JCM 21142]